MSSEPVTFLFLNPGYGIVLHISDSKRLAMFLLLTTNSLQEYKGVLVNNDPDSYRDAIRV